MLTNHQKEKIEEAIRILKNNNILLIKGSAGVGKTYLVNELIHLLVYQRIIIPKSQNSILCSAPTNKAVAVLKGKVNFKNLTFVTIHSAMKLKRVIDNKTGANLFKPVFDERFPPLMGCRLLIIDECSMINQSLLENIEHYAKRVNCKVIFIGDDKQINPVNEDDSPVFLQNYPEIELTEIVRQGKDNPIITLSRNLELINLKKDIRTDIGGFIYTYDLNRIIGTLASVNGTDDLKYLAYTNKDVDTINNKVRKVIYGNPNKIELGETLVFNAPIANYFTNEEIKVEKLRVAKEKFNVPLYNNGRESTYESVELKFYSINYSKVALLGTDEYIDYVKVIHEESEKDFKKVCSLIRARAMAREIKWIDYYNFIEDFADLKYNHALSIHKSQGSTYKQVIINIKNIEIDKNMKEKQRLLYTAVTRASELIILYNV